MKHIKTTFLKMIVIMMGLFILGLCVFWVPMIGNYFAHITQFALLKYVIVIFLYSTAIPYFYALYHTLLILAYISQQNAFSNLSGKSLRYIKYCASIITGLYVLFLPILYIMAQADDAPGLLLIGFIIIIVSTVVAVFSAVLKMLWKNALAIKSDNDLTI